MKGWVQRCSGRVCSLNLVHEEVCLKRAAESEEKPKHITPVMDGICTGALYPEWWAKEKVEFGFSASAQIHLLAFASHLAQDFFVWRAAYKPPATAILLQVSPGHDNRQFFWGGTPSILSVISFLLSSK